MDRGEEALVEVARALGRALVGAGVRHLFGVLGSGNFVVANAAAQAGARFVAARHESAAVSMADGYGRVTRGLGVATVHQGPGLTNAVTALTEAAKARTPLLLLAADTSAAAVRSNFRIDAASLAASVGATAVRLESPASALDDAQRALDIAVGERRTVVLLMPLDVQAAAARQDRGLSLPARERGPAPSSGQVAEVADLLAGAERPAIIAGRGAVLAGAGEALQELGERTGALLATSANANGLFAGDPYYLGISGGFASPTAARLLAESDLVVAFGASLNMWTTRHGTLVDSATVVQVDIDPGALGGHLPVAVGLVGDAALTAAALCDELQHREGADGGRRTAGVAAAIAAGRWRQQDHAAAPTGATIDPRDLSRALDDLLPAERTLAIDSGHFMGWPAMYLEVPDADGFVFTQSFQSVGLGLGSAIGAAIARPDRLTVAALGDGGAMMALAELETAARLRLPMLVVVYDDAAYGAEVHHFAPQGHAVDLVRFHDADFAALGRAAGGDGITVRDVADLDAVRGWLQQPDKPLVVDAKIAPDIVAEWLEEAFRAH